MGVNSLADRPGNWDRACVSLSPSYRWTAKNCDRSDSENRKCQNNVRRTVFVL